MITIVARFNIKVVAAVGLCGAAVALSPAAAAAPLKTGGYDCFETAAGGNTPVAAEVCSPASAPVAEMSGVPLALPGPVPAPVPWVTRPVGPRSVGAPIPVGAPVPVGAPIADMSGTYAGKGDPTGPAPTGALVPGQPVLPGPSAAG